jgi:hypothetical protein
MINKLKTWYKDFCGNTATKMTNWIGNGGWITICVLGAFGVICASTGMIMHLINFAKEDLPTFFAMLFIGLIVLGTAVFGIYAIVKTIRRNKDLFKY